MREARRQLEGGRTQLDPLRQTGKHKKQNKSKSAKKISSPRAQGEGKDIRICDVVQAGRKKTGRIRNFWIGRQHITFSSRPNYRRGPCNANSPGTVYI